MAHLQWTNRPVLDRPVVIAAFEGWNDAGDAASGAVRWFADRWDAEAFATIDPEVFFDFTSTRPEVRIEGESRVIDWPTNEFSAGRLPESGRDVILLRGVEPQLRWRTFCEAVLEVVGAYDASMVVTLGALLAEVPHSRPVDVAGTAADRHLVDHLGLAPTRYEGPTGIVGVLHAACQAAGHASASLWATVPTYVPGAPSPKATLALVERTATLLRTPVITTDLEIAAASYERQINELVEEDDETQAYVAALEQRHDESELDDRNLDDPALDDTDPDDFIAEVEEFLRDSGD